MKIPSRNRKTIHEDRCDCPYCKAVLYYDLLKENNYITKVSENTDCVTCPMCDGDFIPDVTVAIEYKYSGKCKRKDGKDV